MHAPPTAVVPFLGAVAVVIWRIRETTKPLSKRSILIPPLAMSTGHLMFLYPPTRVPLSWAFTAYLVGAIALAFPLIRTTCLAPREDAVYVTRSKAFLWVIFGLLAVRTILREYISQYVSLLQTGALFYLLAFGMILHWRVNMWRRFKRLQAKEASKFCP